MSRPSILASLDDAGGDALEASSAVIVGLVGLALGVYALLLFGGSTSRRPAEAAPVRHGRSGTVVSVQPTSWTIRLNDDGTVPASASSTLREIARYVRDQTAIVVTIARDTSDEAALRQSEDRALAVISALEAQVPGSQALRLQGEVHPEPSATEGALRHVTVTLVDGSQ